ncbi:unnamed protein product [Bathycoccus prasinos]
MREEDSETNNQPASSSSSLSSSSKRAPDRKDEDNKEEKLVKSKIKTESFLPAITTTTALLSLACVPIHILTAFASVVGVGTSVHVLRAAYKPAMNRCRCHLKSEKQWLAESASRSASMVSLESFAQRQSEDAKDAENEADGAENEETKKGNIKRRKERRRSAGLHCQRCLKRTRKGVRVSFLTSPALVGFVSGAIAFGFSSASAFALRRGKGVLFGALANAQPTKSSKTKKKK